MKGEIFTIEGIENMNKEELIETFEKLDAKLNDLKQVYEENFGDKIGKEISDKVDTTIFDSIRNELFTIILAKHCIAKRLSSEFNIFIM